MKSGKRFSRSLVIMVALTFVTLFGACSRHIVTNEEQESVLNKVLNYEYASKSSYSPQNDVSSKKAENDTQSIKESKNDGKNELTEAYLVRVVDGDTVLVMIDDKEFYVRLIGIDTPESVNPDESKNTPEGVEASEWLKLRLKDIKVIYLEFDIEKYDKYGRLLAYVYVDDSMLNKEILHNGYASPLIIEPNTKYSGFLDK